jgi:hypothetical protein
MDPGRMTPGPQALPQRSFARARRFMDKRRRFMVRFWRRLVIRWRLRSQPLPLRGRFLVTGPSGVGKSEVGTLLGDCGFNAVDADDAFGYFGDRGTGEPVPFPDRLTHDWYDRHGWLWLTEPLLELLADERQPLLFICGCADDEDRFYPYFDRIFVLGASTPTLEGRLATRGRDCMTTDPVALERLRKRNRDPLGPYPAGQAVAVDGEEPPTLVVRRILREAARSSSASSR